MSTKAFIILPAYNEEKSLPSLLRQWDYIIGCYNIDAELIVINDGSTDSTSEIARSFKASVPLIVKDIYPNSGLANATREGFLEALSGAGKNDIIILMDADNSHNPGLSIQMLNKINEGADIVIASRYRRDSRIIGLVRFRKFLSWGASILFRIIIGIRGVRDYTCGYRAYRAELISKAVEYYKGRFIQQKGFAVMAEILIKLKRFKPVIIEVPMILRYDKKESESKLRIFRTIVQTLKMLIGIK
jgi:dolichol-phosphate mannosyltransferase